MKNWKLLTVILAMLVFVLAACGDSKEESGDKESNTGKDTEQQTGAYPITIKSTVEGYEDQTFEKAPEKIVVFDYGFLDTLDTLGVEVTAVAKGNFPENLKKYADDKYLNAGGLKEPLFEDIAAMQPDVIFISGRQADAYEQLNEIAPTVFVGTNSADYINSFKASVNIAAELFGKQDEAAAKLAEFDKAVEEVKTAAEASGKKALVTLYNETMAAYGPGEKSRYGFVHNVYGFEAATNDLEDSNHGAQLSYEQILEINPDILFVIDRLAATGEESNIHDAIENDIINKTNAAKDGKIVYLNGALWYLAGGGLSSELAKVEEVKAALQ
ncbi:siderophore ABC transporter substrate-binding protein [Lysinibacillus sp. 54212]|uniref:siderophore ABC transporter substrate-binding protein n=1 Tax=Lysinibacillus sp. 54212 TaxID=3119829 RepID=UPI002FCC955B